MSQDMSGWVRMHLQTSHELGHEQIRGMGHEEYLVHWQSKHLGELSQTYASCKEESRERPQRIFETVLPLVPFIFIVRMSWTSRANRLTPAHVTSFRTDEGMHSHLTGLPVWLFVTCKRVSNDFFFHVQQVSGKVTSPDFSGFNFQVHQVSGNECKVQKVEPR